MAVSGLALAAPSATAATTTLVALTFDNNTSGQFTLGYQQALQPHGVPATFYVNSGTVGVGSARMTWAQLGTLAAAGNEIGGKTVDGTNLTTLTPQQQINEICTDRQNILAHGLKPFSFAYPGGAFNATIQTRGAELRLRQRQDRGQPVPGRAHLRGDPAAQGLAGTARLRPHRPGHPGQPAGPGDRGRGARAAGCPS